MDIPVKKLRSGFSLPVYGLGTWNMGGGWDEPNSTNDQAEVAAIQAALQRGITHIDTAELYGGGHCEELVGEAIRGFDRSKLIITTKVLQGMAGGYDGVLRAAETSARRLGVDYLDLYLLHRYPRGKVAEVVSALDHLVEQGLVKNIGICNVTAESFEDVQRHSANKLVCDQVDYSLQVREAERRGVLEYCQKNDIFLIAWGPLNKGMLEQGGLLQELAAKYGKTPYQIALNWIINQPNVITIPKTSQVEHLEENLGALGWQLQAEDAEKLTKDFPGQQAVSKRVPLE